MLELIDNRVVCLVEGNAYDWYYQRSLDVPVHKLGHNNSVKYIGKGYYICNVTLVEGSQTFMMKFGESIIPHKSPIVPSEKTWDFNKIPPKEYPRIKELVQAQRWKTLLIDIHNRYKVSSNTYCCSLKSVERHFKEFVNGM